MTDQALSWFGRIWIAVTILGMLGFYFFGFRPSITERWVLAHIGRPPTFQDLNQPDIDWWVATIIVALPGVAALILRDILRRLIPR